MENIFLNKTQKAEHLTENYKVISIGEAAQPLLESGWSIYRQYIDKARKAHNIGLTKHLLTLVKSEDLVKIQNKTLGVEAVPSVNLVNAHNGTSAVKIQTGLVRLVCLNGLIAGQNFHIFRFTHRGADLQNKINHQVPAIAAQAESMVDVFSEWSKVSLDEQLKVEFLNRALDIRGIRPNSSSLAFEVHNMRVLDQARRSFDTQDTLWHLFNRVQENLIRGGGRVYRNDKEHPEVLNQRRLTAVNSINESQRINQEVFDLAESMFRKVG